MAFRFLFIYFSFYFFFNAFPLKITFGPSQGVGVGVHGSGGGGADSFVGMATGPKSDVQWAKNSIMMLVRFGDLSQSDCSKWVMWQVKDPQPRPGWDGCLTWEKVAFIKCVKKIK